MSQRLQGFLAARGITRERFVAAIAEPFGRPLLVVAAGSILHGVGNKRSDVDINIVVKHNVSMLPIPAFAHTVLLDMTYFDALKVQNWASKIRNNPWPSATPVNRELWRQRYLELLDCTRFGYGLMLSAQDSWDNWRAAFREQWFVNEIVQWWRIESLRRWVGGRWLAETKPLLAAQCLLDALHAALESRAADCGQLYFGKKWLSEKLRTLGDEQGLSILSECMRSPTTEREARAYLTRSELLLAELNCGFSDELAVQVWYAPGVKVREMDGSTLVSRWDLNGFEYRGTLPVVPEPPAPFWEGNLMAPPPDDVLALFLEEMTWLSVVAKTTLKQNDTHR